MSDRRREKIGDKEQDDNRTRTVQQQCGLNCGAGKTDAQLDEEKLKRVWLSCVLHEMHSNRRGAPLRVKAAPRAST